VGTAKPVTISTVNLVGGDAGNYTVGVAPATSADITIKSITVTAAATSRAWINGSVGSTTLPTISPSLAWGDSSNFSQTYDNPDVGVNKTLTPSGNVTDGNGGANYSVTFVSANTGTITATMAAPVLSTVGINSGVGFAVASQRSQIVKLTVNFNNSVTLDAGAISLENLGLLTANAPGSVMIPTGQILYTPGTGTSFVITFGAGTGVITRGGGAAAAVNGNSLADGNYKLTVDASKVHQVDGQPIGANTFGSYADNFFRMFGDSDGDGDVDGTDTIKFRQALTTYNAALDWDGNGSVTNGSVDSTNFNSNNSKKRRLF